MLLSFQVRPFILLIALAVWPAAASARSSGCGAPVAPGERVVDVRHEGKSRPVHLYVPAGYDPARPTPLLLNLHGSGGTGKDQFALSGLASAADQHGVLVASPDAGIAAREGFLWNVPGVPTVAGTIPGPEAPDDTAYLVAVTDAVAAALCVDKSRLYATGLSGGGRMASWLACARADRFAAIAPVVGLRAGRARADETSLVDETSCRPSRPVAVLAFAGARDRTNPNAGGEGLRWGYSMDRAMQRWAQLNGCAMPAPTAWIDARRYRQHYTGCADGGSVEARIDAEGGHNWTVADTGAMLGFLLAHRLPEQAD